jgi:hypothetical protein
MGCGQLLDGLSAATLLRDSGGVKREMSLGRTDIFIASIAFADGFDSYFLGLFYDFFTNRRECGFGLSVFLI